MRVCASCPAEKVEVTFHQGEFVAPAKECVASRSLASNADGHVESKWWCACVQGKRGKLQQLVAGIKGSEDCRLGTIVRVVCPCRHTVKDSSQGQACTRPQVLP